jgi:hypothetical protein
MLVPMFFITKCSTSGFTGTNDVWSVYQGVLVDITCMVWEYNPDGVFNPTKSINSFTLKQNILRKK